MSLKMINKFSILFLIVVLSACSPINYDDAPDYNAYFPLNESDSSEYLVHEIQHTSLGTDTLRYFLKEVVKLGYIDGEGDLAYQFHRYWKQDSLTEYSLKDVWSIKKKSKSAEKVEENIRYVKMIFPLDEQSYWDGNLFNSLGYKEYTINQIHMPYTLNSAYFDSIVEIAKRDKILRGQNDIVNMFFVNAIDGNKGPTGRGMMNGNLVFISLVEGDEYKEDEINGS